MSYFPIHLFRWYNWGVFALLAIMAVTYTGFGVYRIRKRKKNWKSIVQLIVGIAFSIGGAAGFYTLHHAIETVIKGLEETKLLGAFPPGWGDTLSPEKRTQYSRSLSEYVFVHKGIIHEYFDQSGNRRPYEPSDEDLGNRAAFLRGLITLKHESFVYLGSSLAYLLLLPIGVLLGYRNSWERLDKWYEQRAAIRLANQSLLKTRRDLCILAIILLATVYIWYLLTSHNLTWVINLIYQICIIAGVVVIVIAVVFGLARSIKRKN